MPGTVPLAAEATVSWDICGTCDFNSDGKADIFWRHKVNGKNSVWIMDGLVRVGALSLDPVTDNNWKIEN